MPVGHHYTETITERTCTAAMDTTYTCEDCGASYIGDYTDKEMHKYTKSVSYPPCNGIGYTTYTCVNAAIFTRVITRIRGNTITMLL